MNHKFGDAQGPAAELGLIPNENHGTSVKVREEKRKKVTGRLHGNTKGVIYSHCSLVLG